MTGYDWKFRNTPPDGERRGGDLAAMSFERDLETFVREVLQNSHDAAYDAAEGVTVTFRFEELRGEEKAAFLEAASWSVLSEHLRASVQSLPVLRESIRRTEKSDAPLRVLGVHDGEALGLSGPERGTQGRFAMFARNKLLSEKRGADAGGSFGLGKSVFWTFSGWHTVFAYSLPVGEAEQPESPRFVGVSQLPYHEIGRENFDGPGWYGRLKGIPTRRYADSVRRPAAPFVQRLRLDREPEWNTGTSVLIPDFLPPEGGDTASIGRLIAEAAARWFWPLLARDRLSVFVEVNGERERVDPGRHEALAPWLHLAGIQERGAWRGNTFRRTLSLKIPNVHEVHRGRDEFVHHRKTEVESALEVAVVQADDLPKEGAGSIALLRGSGMVVKIMPVRADRPFFGLVRAGLALGEGGARRIVEQFMRAAEPPSHNDWVKTAPKLADLYGPGYKGTLDGLPRRIRETAALLIRSRDAARTPDALPNILKKTLHLGSGKSPGIVSRSGRFNFGLERCLPVDVPGRSGWSLEGWVSSSYRGAWGFVVECRLRGDSENAPISLVDLEVSSGAIVGPAEGRVARPGRVEIRCFAPLDDFSTVAQDAIFEVQIKRKRIRKEAKA
ncbi:MAG: hypothetical protein CMJ83_01235 [Planctomycetes bacterium]|nr:hypothetical protein [Planctomycetota bacterium]